MEILSPWSAFTVLAITLIVIIVAKLIAAIYWEQTYWKSRRVPYIKSIPGLGSMWRLLLRRATALEYNDHMYNSHPNAKYVGFMNLVTPAVMIRDPDLIREIAVKNFDHFMNRRKFVNEELEPIFSKNVSFLSGERWKEMRSVLSPSFTSGKMRFMFELISKCAENFVDYLVEHPEHSSTIEARDVCTRYTNDVICTVAFGVGVNSMKDRDNEFYVRGKTIFNDIFGSMFKMLVINLCPRVAKIFGITLIRPTTTKFFREAILETLQARREQGIVRPDMLHLMMQAKDKENSTIEVTVDDIVSQAFVFFFAGFDSTAISMCYALYELALNPDIQEKLRNEVDRCFDEANGEVSYDRIAKMEYMDMVISETSRKYTFVIFIDRICTREFELPPAEPGYSSVTIKPDDNIWFPIYALHHDPNYFPDPDKFDPERFNKENKEKIHPYTYLPFGVGPRKCIADRFALLETKVLIFHLLRKFVIKPNEKTPIPPAFNKNNLTLTPESGWYLSLEKRES